MADDPLRPTMGGSYRVIDGELEQVEGRIAGYPAPEPEPEAVPSLTPREGGSFYVIDGVLVQVEGPRLAEAEAQALAQALSEETDIAAVEISTALEPLAEEPLQ